ncbi:TPA: hypothetical protein ACN3I6_002589 [Enterococcus faecalis]|uniref:Uncharacterized protein n=2 Tax=Enterococcus faecalis TaxID=1351 RepID=A0ABD7XIV3_ENTFL|nr:hypothetical protein [Enterococcus faecalis]EOM21257.1 hypothetical protein U9C_02999 [Enterococcus faecalis EnGen0253]EOM34385.1 hypothetical protein U9G_00021 [Enterococcus faecalis EnGen0232]EKC6644790.1 hypothetical protein [Enterococcus faecalis]EKZ0039774.1 hypothetical protein [Enterococcus faecalis]EKZ0493743.1 hypothetical protein [Enterococcus faecalis]
MLKKMGKQLNFWIAILLFMQLLNVGRQMRMHSIIWWTAILLAIVAIPMLIRSSIKEVKRQEEQEKETK